MNSVNGWPSTTRNPRPAILIVDDQPVNIQLIEAILGGLEADLLPATSGLEALELIAGRKLALALLDVCMPGLDGFELASQIRGQGNAVPIIFLTAQDQTRDSMALAYSVGGADYLYKPLDPTVLLAKVAVFLDIYRIHEAEESKVRELEALHHSLIRQRSEAEDMAAELALQKAELERVNRELTLRNTQLESFTHVVSHDLRQPLGSMVDYLEMIQEFGGERLDCRGSTWIGACRTIGKEMQDLIAVVLDFSRLGADMPEMSRVDGNSVLALAQANLYSMVKESAALISSDPLPAVLGAETLLTCLFQNLISNAIKYRSANPPVITVSCAWREDDRKWEFRIADNGRGFRNSDSERIFEMFGRSDNALAIPGTGIGLATCKRIVEAHGGRIWADSEPGKGAEFFFLLPDADSPYPLLRS
jgi:two-component system, sensor histidine kinase and response regulator